MMRKPLILILAIFLLFLAYHWRLYYSDIFPPRDVPDLVARACAFDDSQLIGLRALGGEYQRLPCPQAAMTDTARLTDAKGVVARGRPFLLETVVVCRYLAPAATPLPIRCYSYTDGP